MEAALSRAASALCSLAMNDVETNDPKVRRVVEAGRQRGIEVRPHVFSAETRTAVDAAREVGCDVAQIVKTLVFRSEDRPLLFLVAGDNRLDAKRAAHAAGVPEVEKVDAAGAKAATGFSIGATPPFGHDRHIPVFMDEDLLQHEEVWAAAGRPDAVFPTDPTKLQAAVDAVVAELKE